MKNNILHHQILDNSFPEFVNDTIKLIFKTKDINLHKVEYYSIWTGYLEEIPFYCVFCDVFSLDNVGVFYITVMIFLIFKKILIFYKHRKIDISDNFNFKIKIKNTF